MPELSKCRMGGGGGAVLRWVLTVGVCVSHEIKYGGLIICPCCICCVIFRSQLLEHRFVSKFLLGGSFSLFSNRSPRSP